MRIFLGAMIGVLAVSACDRSAALDEPYGPAGHLEMETPEGVLSVEIAPWSETPDVSAETVLADAQKSAARGERVRKSGEPAKIAKLGKSVWARPRELKSSKGKPRASLLFACTYKGKDQYSRLIDAYGPAEFFKRTSKDAGMKQMRDAVEDACKQSPERARNAAIQQAVTTKPGKGNARAMLKHYVHQEVDGRSGDFFVINEYTYAMMKNGWAVKNIAVPLDDLDAKKLRQIDPERWVEWRKKRGKFEIKTQDDDADWTPLKGRVRAVKPAKTNKRYTGKFQHVRTSGSMTFNSSSTWRHYTFDKKGNYTSSRSSFGGSGTMSSIFPDMGSFAHASSCDESGGSSVSSMLHPVMTVGTKSQIDGCGDGKAGTYKVKGFTIELTANNGAVQRLPFIEEDKNNLFIGSRGYWRETKKDQK